MMMTLTGGGGAAADGGGAMKAALRHAMLQHEVVFRNQVRELHRLYWTQKNLMREMCRAAGEAALASASASARSQTVETGVCDGDVRQEKQREMMLDLQLPADEYIRGGGVPVSTGSETRAIDLSSLNGGLKDSTFAPSIDISTQKPISTAGKRLHIDLNLDQEHESFNHLNNSTITFPSPATSSSVQCTFFWREPSNIRSKESMTCQSDLVNPSSNISGGKVAADLLFHTSQDMHHAQSNKVTETSWKHESGAVNKVRQSDLKGPEKVQTSLNKVIPSPKGLHELGEQNAYSSSGRPHSNVQSDNSTQALAVIFNNSFDCNNRHTSVGSTNPLATVTTESDGKQANCDGSEEDTVSSHAIPRDKDQESGHEELSVLKKPAQVNGNSDIKDPETTQLNSTTKDFSFFPTCIQVCKGELEPQVPLAEATATDCMITVAAEVLVSLSFETLEKTTSSEKLVSVEQRESEDDQPDLPQYSSDSYESITLKLSETRDDRFTMPVTSTEETVENNLCSVKLRRGRRMRDFQKDVLPGLVSLSRHEIREDLQIIGYEHRRNKSRQLSPSWLVPVRRRRSTRKSAGQRC